MIDTESLREDSYREYAAECVRLAESEAAPEDKNILLNVALAWVRLAHQTRSLADDGDPAESEVSAPELAS
jgi:hypothetical protein